MGLEDEVRHRLDGAVSGISRPLAIDMRDPLGRLSTANMEVIARVVEVQSDALVRHCVPGQNNVGGAPEPRVAATSRAHR